MAGEWLDTTWGDIAELKYGKAMTAYTDQPNVARVYGTNGPIGWHDTALQPGPGVIVGRKGAYRGVHYADHPFWVIDTAYYLQPLVPMDLRWAYYWLLNYDVNNIDDGSPIPSTTREAFGFTPVKFPPLAEQAKIANVLASLDAKVDANRQTAATLEEMARALFKSWFVDLDAVHAKAEGRDPGLPADIAELFPAEFDEEGLPKGWQKRQFSELVLQDRETVDPTIFGDNLVEHFSLPAFDAGQQPALESASSIKSIKLKVSSPVALFSKLNPATPRVWAIETGSVKPQIASTEFLAFRPKDRTVTFAFIVELLMSRAFRDRASSMVTGTSKSHQRVQPAALLETEWDMPTKNLLNAFDSVAAPILKRRELLRDEAASLIALRDSILPKLLSGSLLVTETETAIAAA